MDGVTRRLRAVLYARVSRTDGEQDPEVQLRALRQWAAQRGWEVVAEEADRVTGDPSRRRREPPGLGRALERLAQRRADVLAVFSADRLLRSTVGLLQLVGRVQSYGAHVASYQDGTDLDTTSDLGELMVFMRGWVARMELRLIRSRTREGMAAARAKGARIGRPPVELPDAQAVAELRAQGLTLRQVARQLGVNYWRVRRVRELARPGA